jgi:uncharacterized membrane protein SirB2
MVYLVRNYMRQHHIQKKKKYEIAFHILPMIAQQVMRFVKIDGIIVISIVDLVQNDIQHGHIKKKMYSIIPYIVEPQVMRCVK